MQGAEIKISKFEPYPKLNPICYVVGFTVRVSAMEFYRDTTIPLSECTGLDEKVIVGMGYTKLETNIQQEVDYLLGISPLVGEVFDPTNT